MKKLMLIAMAAVMTALGAGARTNLQGLKVYINPGHGGYTSNDRPIHLYPFPANDSLGYWESKSNLYKGLHLYHILDSLGAKPYLSRTKNTEADDRSLSGIAAEANQLGCDLLFSIHSNAGEDVNTPLMLYRENEIGTPRYPENVTISKLLWKNLHSSKLAVWTRNSEYVVGDLTFYQNMWQGGLGVLRTLYLPGLLSEGSMHEHRPEAYRLMNDDYWWLEAWHFVKSIMEFYDTDERFVTGNVAGVVYDDHNLREIDMPFNYHAFGRDKFAPVNFAHIELIDKDGKTVQTRTTDNMYNGVYVFRNVAPGNYTVKVTHSNYYTEQHPVSVTACEVSYQDVPLTLKREFPLEITSWTPRVAEGEGVSCATTLDFTFNTDIDTESFERAFTITPAVDGYFRYSDSYRKASFVPSVSLDVNTRYTVTISTEARTPDTHYSRANLQQPLEYSFSTLARNRLEMIDHFPAAGGTVHYSAPTFEFRFDKSIEYSSIYDLIKVTDSKGNQVSINRRGSSFNKLSSGYGNAVFAVTGNLTVGETYHVSLSGELRDREKIPMVNTAEFDFVAVDETAGHTGDVVENFEEAVVFAYDPEQSKGIGSTLPTSVRSTSVRLFDKASARLGYKFTDTHGGEAVWSFTGAPHRFFRGDELGVYINGDFNNHELYVGLTSGTDKKYAKLCDLNFLGWQYHSVKLDMLEDGYTYLLSDIKVVQKESPITQNGNIALDNIMVTRSAGVADIEADDAAGISVYPVPATDVVNVESADAISSLTLVDAAGAVVARAGKNSRTISVAHLPAGFYLLRIATANGTEAVRRVAVAH